MTEKKDQKRGRGRPKSKPTGAVVNMQVVNMPTDLVRRVDIQAAVEGRHKYLLVAEALEDYLAKSHREAFAASKPVYE